MTPLEKAVHDENLLNKAEHMIFQLFEKALGKWANKPVTKKGVLIPAFNKAIPKLKTPKGVLAQFSYRMEVVGPPYIGGVLEVSMVLEKPLSFVNGRSFWVGGVRDGMYRPSKEDPRLLVVLSADRLIELSKTKESLYEQMVAIDREISRSHIEDRLIRS